MQSVDCVGCLLAQILTCKFSWASYFLLLEEASKVQGEMVQFTTCWVSNGFIVDIIMNIEVKSIPRVDDTLWSLKRVERVRKYLTERASTRCEEE